MLWKLSLMHGVRPTPPLVRIVVYLSDRHNMTGEIQKSFLEVKRFVEKHTPGDVSPARARLVRIPTNQCFQDIVDYLTNSENVPDEIMNDVAWWSDRLKRIRERKENDRKTHAKLRRVIYLLLVAIIVGLPFALITASAWIAYEKKEWVVFILMLCAVIYVYIFEDRVANK